MTNKATIKIISILFFIFIFSGCSLFPKASLPDIKNSPDDSSEIDAGGVKTIDEQLVAQSKINKFTNLDELKEFLEQGEGVSGYGYPGLERMVDMDFAEEIQINAPLAAKQAVGETAGLGAGADDFSKTNVQVEGVDEADIIKTDGKYIYAVVKNDLFIISAYPTENVEILAKIEFESRPQDIYINDNNLVIFGLDDKIFENDAYKRFKRRGNYTFLKVFDITDRKNPQQVRNLNFEGSYHNSRLIGDYVYFVTSSYNYYYIEDEPVIPRIIENGEILANDCMFADRCFVPDIYYFDVPYNAYNFTTVTAINVKNNNEAIVGDVYLLSGSQNMYVSKNNIYITYTKYISEYQLEMEVMKEIIYPLLSVKDQGKIAKIEEVENFILSKEEKMGKIGQIIERFAESLSEEEQERLEKQLEKGMKQKYDDISKELEKTVIHKIAINENNIEYKNFGEVTGHVLNQFSMDESNGYFRIATTKNRTWSRYEEEQIESYSNLYVLDENLKTVGALEGLAEGERIYSARFMQERAYLVTFKQMDPLFVIDLSNPRDPKVLGELKIPGYSDYLHPYDDTTLIGLGKDTGETEWGGVRTKGIKLSLFDVSDVSQPKEVDTYIIGDAGSDSIALHDHKAFLFSHDKNLLAIPASIRESLGEFGQNKLTFVGAVIFNINKDGFELKGKIDHSDGGQPSDRDYWQGHNYYDNTVKRCLYINDVLYTFSNEYLKMNKLDDLELVKKLELKKKKSGDDFEVIN